MTGGRTGPLEPVEGLHHAGMIDASLLARTPRAPVRPIGPAFDDAVRVDGPDGKAEGGPNSLSGSSAGVSPGRWQAGG